jgi:hypothetical protein
MDPVLREREGRIYVMGASREVGYYLRCAGAHLEPERKQWWVGRARRDSIELELSKMGIEPRYIPEGIPFRGVDTVCVGRARYNGEEYYVIWAGERDGYQQMKLVARDASEEFYANIGDGEHQAQRVKE